MFLLFLSHPAAFGFWASTPLDNIILNAADKKTDKYLTAFRLATVCLLILIWGQSTLFLI